MQNQKKRNGMHAQTKRKDMRAKATVTIHSFFVNIYMCVCVNIFIKKLYKWINK